VVFQRLEVVPAFQRISRRQKFNNLVSPICPEGQQRAAMPTITR
jgi:hypothetical protein